MAWTLFEYESGSNPYVAFTEERKKQVIRRNRRMGHAVTERKPGFYIIDDRRTK